MQKSDWIWMPHPGHFICAKDCKFHLNTGVGNYIVSTVGEYWPDQEVRKIHAQCRNIYIPGKGEEYDFNYMETIGFVEIGCDRLYETMVFEAELRDNNSCCPYRIISGTELDMRGYNKPEDAFKGHMELCEKWSLLSKKLMAGLTEEELEKLNRIAKRENEY